MLNSLVKCVQCVNLSKKTIFNYTGRTFIIKYRHLSNFNYKKKHDENSITSKQCGKNNHFKQNRLTDLTDSEYIVKLKDDPDQFGGSLEEEIIDEGDVQEEKYFTEQADPAQKLSTKKYSDIIKKLITERKIKEAIDVVEVRMLKEDRAKPDNYLYNLLLGACGRVGYTKKAFMLYNKMKGRGFKIMGGTYTALFNACANSPWPTTDGLSRATGLYNIMIEKGYEPNDANYNSMIKAFGRCGDLPMAFKLVDDMCSKGFRIKDDTINFLLQACISDKEAGFRHALLVWRKLINKKIKPTIYTYNLMLRCVRDCGLGDINITRDVINKILLSGNLNKNEYNLLGIDENSKIENSMATDSSNETNKSDSIIIHNEGNLEQNINQNCLRPNLLADIPHLGNIIEISEVKKPEERLLLIGGFNGFLDNIYEHDCTPDIKTFTQLLDTIPSTIAAEDELIGAMKRLIIKPDIDFFNMLIKKRSMRSDYQYAKNVLSFFKDYGYRPNLITYGVLAISCKTKHEALELINEMQSHKYTLNAEILGTMLHQACYRTNFVYVMEVMELCLRENIQPNKIFMQKLLEFKKKGKKMSDSKEFSKSEETEYRSFRRRYQKWIHEVEVDESEDAHPWQQFRQAGYDGKSKFKWKDTARFKAIRLSRFKVKTSKKLRY